MATLATHFRKEDAVIYGEDVPVAPPRRLARRAAADQYRLRSLPNEDVYFFSKRIDNSRILKEKDPGAPKECWSAIGAFGVMAILLTTALAPSVGQIVAGYQLQSLKQPATLTAVFGGRWAIGGNSLLGPAKTSTSLAVKACSALAENGSATAIARHAAK